MRDYSLTHLRDDVLLRDLAALIVEERGTIASILAHLAEVDVRKLYVPLGYSSLYVYCREELRLSEDSTCKGIQAARAARRFPILFTELAEGRLHVTAVCMLAPHLTPENVEDLVRAAAHRRKSEIEELLACCFSSGSGNQTVLAPEEPAPEQVNGSMAGGWVTGARIPAGLVPAGWVPVSWVPLDRVRCRNLLRSRYARWINLLRSRLTVPEQGRFSPRSSRSSRSWSGRARGTGSGTFKLF